MVPPGTKIAAKTKTIYSPYTPLARRQQREDQLVCVARGSTTCRVRQLAHYTSRLERQLCTIPPLFIQNVHTHPKKHCIRVVHVSDTNNHHRYLQVPTGNLFVCTGNFTNPELPRADAIGQFKDFLAWLASLVVPRFDKVVFIAGNHDDILDRSNHSSLGEHLKAQGLLRDFLAQHPSVTYLENSGTVFGGLYIYGSPTVYHDGLIRQHFLSNAFERNDASESVLRNTRKVDILLTNRAPSILKSSQDQDDYSLPTDVLYKKNADVQKRKDASTSPTVHAFGHCNMNFGIGYYMGTLMMNGSQEALLRSDKYGGGTPLVIDVPVPSSHASNVTHAQPAALGVPHLLRSGHGGVQRKARSVS